MKSEAMTQSGGYTGGLIKRGEAVFDYAAQLSGIRSILGGIAEKAEGLKLIIMTEEEKEENNIARNAYDARMLEMAAAASDYLERYQLYGWRELIDRGSG